VLPEWVDDLLLDERLRVVDVLVVRDVVEPLGLPVLVHPPREALAGLEHRRFVTADGSGDGRRQERVAVLRDEEHADVRQPEQVFRHVDDDRRYLAGGVHGEHPSHGVVEARERPFAVVLLGHVTDHCEGVGARSLVKRFDSDLQNAVVRWVCERRLESHVAPVGTSEPPSASTSSASD